MKLIHTADLHLASEMESRLSPEKAKLRRKELFETFERMADYAEKENVTAILLCGDVFDEGKPGRSAIDSFIRIVEEHPSVSFLCLSGNHDESLESLAQKPENLLCFGRRWKKYSFGNVDVWGFEQDENNLGILYETLDPLPDRVNVVMLHGQVLRYAAKPARDTVVLPSLIGKNIDYLALGHIHTHKEERLDERGVWCYCGCPEGRGYDECGEKGFVLLKIDDGKIERRFVPFSKRTVFEIEVDVTGCEDEAELEDRIREKVRGIPGKDLLRLVLTGSTHVSFTVNAKRIGEYLENDYFSVSVKDKTRIFVNTAAYLGEQSLRGELSRLLLEDKDLSDEDKQQIMRCALLALEGEEAFF